MKYLIEYYLNLSFIPCAIFIQKDVIFLTEINDLLSIKTVPLPWLAVFKADSSIDWQACKEGRG